MACTDDRFVVTKGIDNEFVLTIKQNSSTLPMVIEGGDTFSSILVNLATGAETNIPTSVSNAAGGQITLTLSESAANNLASEKGGKVDHYYLKPTYKLIVDCSTANNGDFVAKIRKVYVD